jgi:hypothetical protein
METYGGVVVQIQVILTSSLVEGEWSASHRGTHWVGGWVGPRTGLDIVEMRKVLTLLGLKLRSLCRAPRSYSDCALPAPSVNIFSPPLVPTFGAYGWFLSFLIILQTVGLLGRAISSSQGLYLNIGQQKHRKTRLQPPPHQTVMPWVGFEPTIPASERAKTVHALDRAATVTGLQ